MSAGVGESDVGAGSYEEPDPSDVVPAVAPLVVPVLDAVVVVVAGLVVVEVAGLVVVVVADVVAVVAVVAVERLDPLEPVGAVVVVDLWGFEACGPEEDVVALATPGGAADGPGSARAIPPPTESAPTIRSPPAPARAWLVRLRKSIRHASAIKFPTRSGKEQSTQR